jgi:hypothetical protein
VGIHEVAQRADRENLPDPSLGRAIAQHGTREQRIERQEAR